MKNTLLLFSFLFVINITCYSQSKKNNLKFGVSFLPLVSKTEGVDGGISGVVLKPSVGYYISNTTSLELNFTYASSRSIKVNNIDSAYNSYAFTPTVRNNFINNEKLRLFGELGYGLGTIYYYADDGSSNTERHRNLSGGISIIQVGAGINYYFNSNWGLEIVIPYIHTNNITSDFTDNLYSGLGPTIGISYILN